jgi:hypothetical protein
LVSLTLIGNVSTAPTAPPFFCAMTVMMLLAAANINNGTFSIISRPAVWRG